MKFCIFFCFTLAISAATAQQYVIWTVAGGAPVATPIGAVSLSLGTVSGVAADGAGNAYLASSNPEFGFSARSQWADHTHRGELQGWLFR
jgi:hypothetical protein